MNKLIIALPLITQVVCADALWYPANQQVNLSKNAKCYIYKSVSVIDKNQLGDGSGIFIKRGVQNCNWKLKNADTVAKYPGTKDMNISFEGIFDNKLFLDNGCCPGSRGMVIYDINTHKQLYNQQYIDDGAPASPTISIDKISKNRILNFWKPNNKKTNQCIHNKAYDKNGLTLITIANYAINLDKTPLVAKKTTTPESCAYAQ